MLFRGWVGAAAFGLALNVVLWSVPGLVGAAGLASLLAPGSVLPLSRTLATAERGSGTTPGLLDALTQLIGAEAEALEVAGLGLQQPTPMDLAPRANRAGARVFDAITTYVRAAAAAVEKSPRH